MAKIKAKTKQRAFLKWAGGKYMLSDVIQTMLPSGKRLIEPFVGAGTVFLNSDYSHYLLNDINQDLINIYQILQRQPAAYIEDTRKFFIANNNDPERYYQLRAEFNASKDSYFRSLIFLYLNRHGYNGLCRYNMSGGFNVPFGRYKKDPYFPEQELNYFAEKAQKATFICKDFGDVFKMAKTNDIIYCDPPYVPLSETASFTRYSGNGFGLDEQKALAKAAEKTQKRKNITVLISNHDTPFTRKIYQQAVELKAVQVARMISQKGGSRNKVAELLVLYK